jgi:hypothetical protein
MVNASKVSWEQPMLAPVNTSTAEVIEVLSAFQVILLQMGLALLEAGNSRRNNFIRPYVTLKGHCHKSLYDY